MVIRCLNKIKTSDASICVSSLSWPICHFDILDIITLLALVRAGHNLFKKLYSDVLGIYTLVFY